MKVGALSQVELPVPPSPDISTSPREYHDLSEAFHKDLVLPSPLHRPHDCAIDLLPGAPLPSSRLYSLTVCLVLKESQKKYINESLAAGIIHPSS